MNGTPPARIDTDICVIGGGSGGLSVAAGASQMGARVVLIEKGEMGGDCLNYGCVPSKALLAAGHAAQAVRGAGRFGVRATLDGIDGKAVYGHVEGVIDAIRPMDSQERFEGLGVTVIREHGRFTGPDRVQAGATEIRAKRFVVATGSSAAVPPIPGLDGVPFLTNESVFDRDTLPDHLIVIGGGPIGVEMAQAHAQLGCTVTLLEMFSIMANDDGELVDVVRRSLISGGIDIREGIKIAGVEKTAAGIAVSIEEGGETRRIAGSHLLVAAGRRANVAGLDLEKAGIDYTPKGITVDRRLRSSNKKVFAIGDVAGGLQFTHVAGYHAGVVIKNALFRIPAKADHSAVPWVTYTAPELAQVGLTEKKAREAGVEFNVLRWPFHDNDRAQAERETEGLVKAIVTPKGKILGCGIAGRQAGEHIQLWGLALAKGMKVGDLATVIAPYPTLGEVSKRAAGSYFTPKLFTDRTRAIVRFLLKLG
ncbi:FAD-dependent oxidoreductase [Thalassospiraceae bacterium LMO-SO8]|nr:FAD-dependent oxidoreductase [Alphaproteobacteria bacterium LMO-S08]WND77264.1 FAD-dependent oxidoreductase [Thalassospiraceae bacterium LMO-SO8]